MSPTNISEAIANASDRLTPVERRIAEVVVAEPTLLAFGTVSELAHRIGTSRPSIVRFASKLGFSGFPALRQTARDGLSRQLSRPTERVRSGQTTSEVDLRTLTEALATLSVIVHSGQLTAMAPLIANANAVWIVSGETSKASAHALRSGLGIIRHGVHLLEDHSLARDLAGAGPNDVAIISDFVRYRRTTVVAAQILASHNVPIIAISDGPLSPLAKFAHTLLEVSVPAVGPFDSSIPSVALAELIIAQVARVNRNAVQERVDRTEELWGETATFIVDE